MKVKLNDKVLVISGKDKGKTGKVVRVMAKNNKIVVEKVNIRTKHIKKTSQRAGEKITFEAPLDASNVMVLDPVQNKPTRIGYRRLENGKRERFAKLSGQVMDTASDTGSAGKAKKTTKKMKAI